MLGNINISEKDLNELEAYKTETGEYLIPVEWSMYSTVRVQADNLKHALEKVQNHIDDIPLDSGKNAEYVDGSYMVSGETSEDFINAQQYRTIGAYMIDKDGNITND